MNWYQVPAARVELARPFERRILNPLRLPVPPRGLRSRRGSRTLTPCRHRLLRPACLPFHQPTIVLEAGVEPTRPFGHQLLRLARLPFHHSSVGAVGENRTRTSLRSLAPQASASTIPPRPHSVGRQGIEPMHDRLVGPTSPPGGLRPKGVAAEGLEPSRTKLMKLVYTLCAQRL